MMMSSSCELIALRKQKPYHYVSRSFEEVMGARAAATEDDDLVDILLLQRIAADDDEINVRVGSIERTETLPVSGWLV